MTQYQKKNLNTNQSRIERSHHGDRCWRSHPYRHYTHSLSLVKMASELRIRYLNVQHWTDDKNTALTLHLTEDKPDVALFTSTSRTRDQTPIKCLELSTVK